MATYDIGPVAHRINEIRDLWHTKKHPFFQSMLDGSLSLRALGIYMACHKKFVSYAMPAFGLLYYRGPHDVQLSVIENISEEEGLQAIPVEGHQPHNHNEMIYRFCRAAGMSDGEVDAIELPPAWQARSYQYQHCLREEPIGVALAMQATQEGQQVALNTEITIPSFQKHYGYTVDSPEIGFFVEHAEADLEHSMRQLSLCEKYLDTPALQARAMEVCETAVKLRWASITEIYRREVLNEDIILPPGVAA